MTATAEPGEVVAIVGPNGAGKSTLLPLVGRLIDLDGGVIRLDGRDLAAHSLERVRKAIGMVGPDLPLMRGSVERTLRYRLPDAGDEELAAVIARCGLQDLIDRLPDGLRSRLSEGGRNLSAGERQRLALARALLGDPRVLLLDEADANLDGGAATIIERVLAAHAGTVLLVTHRVERVVAADQVWHLAGGRLIESGPPTELLAGCGPTARVFAPDARQVA